MTIAIIGAGMAGLSCATALAAAGRATRLFDKGRGPGGRMATRRLDTPLGEASFDHGAQYFTARDPAFQALVADWAASGLVARWPAAGEEAWVGTPAMNAPVKALAAPLEVAWGARVDRIDRDRGGWRLFGDSIPDTRFDAVVIATPAEQAAPLLAPWDPDLATLAAGTRSAPCWTLMAAFADRLPLADCLKYHGIIGWAARNSAKPGRHGPESWVVQASALWSTNHLEEPAESIVAPLLAALSEAAGRVPPEILVASAHRWRFAKSGVTPRGALLNADLRLGACGDWLEGPRVESAHLSGVRLAKAVLNSVSG